MVSRTGERSSGPFARRTPSAQRESRETSEMMNGKTVIITGATSGIGEVAAIRLAEQGARIVFTARDQPRADDTMAKLRQANPGAAHAVHMADLSLLADFLVRSLVNLESAEGRL